MTEHLQAQAVEDLVERLRDRGVCSHAHNSCRNDLACEMAADRIEALQSQLEAADRLAEAMIPFAKAGELFVRQGPAPEDYYARLYNPAAGDEYAIDELHVREAHASLAAYAEARKK